MTSETEGETVRGRYQTTRFPQDIVQSGSKKQKNKQKNKKKRANWENGERLRVPFFLPFFFFLSSKISLLLRGLTCNTILIPPKIQLMHNRDFWNLVPSQRSPRQCKITQKAYVYATIRQMTIRYWESTINVSLHVYISV